MHPQQYPPQQQPGYQYAVTNRQCSFTCCYCCACSYDSHCVHRAAFALDIVLFSIWTLNGIINIGNYGAIGALYIVLVVVFFVQVVLAIMHLCKYQEYIRTGILKQKVAYYLKVRMWMCIYMIVVGIIVGLVYLFVLKALVINNRVINPRTNAPYTDDEATGFGVGAFLGVLIPLLIDVAALYGYKKSFDDSTALLGVNEGGALGSPTPLGQPVVYQGGVYQGGALGPAHPGQPYPGQYPMQMQPFQPYQPAPPMMIVGNSPAPVPVQVQHPLPQLTAGIAQSPEAVQNPPLPPGFNAAAAPEKGRPTVNLR